MIKAILFDMDGTLVDSERYYVEGTYKWIKRYGYKGDKKAICKIIGTTMEETYDIIDELLDHKLSIDEIIKHNTDYFTIEDKIDYKDYIFDEVYEVLSDLKDKGYKMALCSASPYSDIDRFIKDNDLNDIFDYILSTEDTKAKPDPDIYIKAMEHLKCNSKEVIVVEDSPYGILAGKRSGAMTLARINEFTFDKQDQADYKIESLKDIYKYLGE